MSVPKMLAGVLVLALALLLPASAEALCGNKTCYNLDTGPECNFSLFFFNQDCRDGIGWCYSESCAPLEEGEHPTAIAGVNPACESVPSEDEMLPATYELRTVPPRT
jgi:hypothetical protein